MRENQPRSKGKGPILEPIFRADGYQDPGLVTNAKELRNRLNQELKRLIESKPLDPEALLANLPPLNDGPA